MYVSRSNGQNCRSGVTLMTKSRTLVKFTEREIDHHDKDKVMALLLGRRSAPRPKNTITEQYHDDWQPRMRVRLSASLGSRAVPRTP
jgi:hypothetical protein